MIVGVIITFIAYNCPQEVLFGIVGVSGATIFYDTIFKRFQKLFEHESEKEKEEPEENPT